MVEKGFERASVFVKPHGKCQSHQDIRQDSKVTKIDQAGCAKSAMLPATQHNDIL